MAPAPTAAPTTTETARPPAFVPFTAQPQYTAPPAFPTQPAPHPTSKHKYEPEGI
jgi:hypothetical protein